MRRALAALEAIRKAVAVVLALLRPVDASRSEVDNDIMTTNTPTDVRMTQRSNRFHALAQNRLRLAAYLSTSSSPEAMSKRGIIRILLSVRPGRLQMNTTHQKGRE